MRKIAFFMAFVLIIFSAQTALSDQTTTLNVTATAVDACTISTTTLDFGSFDGTTIVSSTATVDVNCSIGVNYSLAFDRGLNSTLNLARWLEDAGHIYSLDYYLYKGGTTQDLGDLCLSPSTIGWACWEGLVGTGAIESHTVDGQLRSAGSSVPSGTVLSDTVTVTVVY